MEQLRVSNLKRRREGGGGEFRWGRGKASERICSSQVSRRWSKCQVRLLRESLCFCFCESSTRCVCVVCPPTSVLPCHSTPAKGRGGPAARPTWPTHAQRIADRHAPGSPCPQDTCKQPKSNATTTTRGRWGGAAMKQARLAFVIRHAREEDNVLYSTSREQLAVATMCQGQCQNEGLLGFADRLSRSQSSTHV